MNRLLKKTAGDFGESNIPDVFISQVLAPNEKVALYWRELVQDNKTVEVWSTSDSTFAIIEGDFSDGEWGIQDLTLVDQKASLDEALNLVNSNYIIELVAAPSRLRKIKG